MVLLNLDQNVFVLLKHYKTIVTYTWYKRPVPSWGHTYVYITRTGMIYSPCGIAFLRHFHQIVAFRYSRRFTHVTQRPGPKYLEIVKEIALEMTKLLRFEILTLSQV